ncbi:MAG: bifunctional acetate--CoA ligase family protein/GNAT family N-acetyltransferase [Proteobacteria bacterium]|nr:bifunctional acetate--CoA ligase family protein/GNAT family N-acetyltransferase [Pseudomonadota bacterium]
MSIRNLDSLFKPSSIAIIGASERGGAIGQVVTRNILDAGFAGAVMLVNPARRELFGRPVHADVASLPQTPELAVICTPAEAAVKVLAELAARGTRAAVVIAAGFSGAADAPGGRLRQALLAAARPALLRVIGPNCLGILAPGHGLNASFAQLQPRAGRLAFVAQSGAILTSVLDWAAPRNIGFSLLASLGDMADVDFGDMLDYLANDADTRAILLYIEGVTHARKFMSAARAAARTKPVIVVKAGRHAAAAQAAASHTGALAGVDAVYDAAFRRAGMLRVLTLEELFDAVETLALARAPRGERLAILTNGGGVGVMATDALMDAGGTLASLSAETLARLDAVLPATWSRANPIDIIGDASAERYTAAVKAVLGAPEIDALLILNCPTAVTSPDAAAAAVLAALDTPNRHALFTSWVGGIGAAVARERFRGAGVPTYDAPEDAVRGFMQMVDYRRNQAALLETPPSMPADFTPELGSARAMIATALAEGREWLSEFEAKAVLACFGIATVATRVAATPREAADYAATLVAAGGGRVAVKIVSRDITHKSDVGGVLLDLAADEVLAATEAMTARVRGARPDAHIEGYAVQAMIKRPLACELIVGVLDDREFGPVILFGAGGVAVEVVNDRALSLPPLNLKLAHDVIARTRVAKLLAGYRQVPAADLEAIAVTLVRLSQLVIDLPQVAELDINPLLADADGVLALDARIRLRSDVKPGSSRLAIRPYPKDLEEIISSDDGQLLLLRPILPEDEVALTATFARLSPEEVRFRFFVPMKLMDHVTAARFSQIDYDRQMALVLTVPGIAGATEIFGVVRSIEDPDRECAEFAIIVEQRMAGRGLGKHLMHRIIDYARKRGVRELYGEVLADNHRMLNLCRECGFKEAKDGHEPGVVRVTMTLRDTPA